MNLSQQALTVREHLFANPHITALQATGVYRIRSISSRISELKRAGYEITKARKADATGQAYVRYSFSQRQRRRVTPVNPPVAPAILLTLDQAMKLYGDYCRKSLQLDNKEAEDEALDFGLFVERNA